MATKKFKPPVCDGFTAEEWSALAYAVMMLRKHPLSSASWRYMDFLEKLYHKVSEYETRAVERTRKALKEWEALKEREERKKEHAVHTGNDDRTGACSADSPAE